MPADDDKDSLQISLHRDQPFVQEIQPTDQDEGNEVVNTQPVGNDVFSPPAMLSSSPRGASGLMTEKNETKAFDHESPEAAIDGEEEVKR